MSAVELHSVGKSFGSTEVLSDVDLSVPEGSMTAVLGESGSGKTTLLRLIAGFEQVDGGRIEIGGRLVDDGRRSLSAQRRGVGYVPQEGALFPHLTVMGNVGFGLARRDRSQAQELIDLVGLGGLGRRYPHELSGGQQQRVALARALAIKPRVVLLDEPFSSLDASLRASVRHDVARILTDAGTTTLIVTHDQDEALGLADQVAVLRRGRMVAVGSPRALYNDPPDPAAAAYIGDANLLDGEISANVAVTALGALPLHPEESLADGPARVLLRPEQLVLHLHSMRCATAATVRNIEYHGHDSMVDLTLDPPGSLSLMARVAGDPGFGAGQSVWVEVIGAVRGWSQGARADLARAPLTAHGAPSQPAHQPPSR